MKKDKNKIMLIISAIMIVIAVIITCVATGVEIKKSKENNSSTTPSIQTTEAAVKNDNKPTDTTKAPETTKKSESNTTSDTGAGKYKVATQDDPLSIRSVPDGDRIYEIPRGEEITVETVYGEWGYVTYDNVGGWVAMKYLKLISADENTNTNTIGKHKIATQDDPLGIRTKPEQDAERNGEVPRGEEVEILAVNGDWGYVEYNGLSGWLSYQYLEKVS